MHKRQDGVPVWVTRKKNRLVNSKVKSKEIHQAELFLNIMSDSYYVLITCLKVQCVGFSVI